MTVQLTPEQRSQIAADVAAGRRPLIAPTPDQKFVYQELIESERSGREENATRMTELLQPLKTAGFSGDLRRAIARQGVPQVAASAGLDDRLLEEFIINQATLTTTQIDLLVDTLGLRLMAEIR